jgi:hypothetical protein
VTIPHPKKDLLTKTVNSILKQAQLQAGDHHAFPHCDSTR